MFINKKDRDRTSMVLIYIFISIYIWSVIFGFNLSIGYNEETGFAYFNYKVKVNITK